MSEIVLEGIDLAVHAANCREAAAHMAELNSEELERSRKVDPRYNPQICLATVFEAVLATFKRHQLPQSTWMTQEVIQVVIDLCKCNGFTFKWNGNPTRANESTRPIFWITPSTDGRTDLVRVDMNTLYRFFPEPLLGLMIWRASEIVFERSLARKYKLSESEVRCLVTGNKRAQALVKRLLTIIGRYNYLTWWNEYAPALERYGKPLHEGPDEKSDLGISLIEPFTDLPLFHPETGERIDLFAGLQPCSSVAYATIVTSVGTARDTAALAPLYEHTTSVTLASPSPTAPSPPATPS